MAWSGLMGYEGLAYATENTIWGLLTNTWCAKQKLQLKAKFWVCDRWGN
jgi:hypothetical protein